MKKSRFTEEQIISILGEAQAGAKVAELSRRHGISDATYYLWKSKYANIPLPPEKHPKGTDSKPRGCNYFSGGNIALILPPEK
jgi:putative transposase